MTTLESLNTVMTARPWADGPVWDCECGVLLAGAAQPMSHYSETVCGVCGSRYRHRLIGDRTWRVTLIEGRK